MKTVTDVSDRIERPTPVVKGIPSPDRDTVVIGAGPYGLSAAAYLKGQGIDVSIFGEPMDFWATKMPKGMLLRSPREASNIADPSLAYTLEAYESASGLKAAAPVPLSTFVEYGRWFQHQLGSSLQRTMVTEVRQENSLFKITLENGSSLTSRRVVVAGGIGPFQRKPPVFAALPATHASHCYEGREIDELARKRVVVIGAGQSALESAALLHEAGSQVEVIAAIPELRWIGKHSWLHHLGPISKLLYSKYDVGPAGISRLVATPKLVSHIPLRARDKIRTRAVRPAGAVWLPARMAPVKVSAGRTVRAAKSIGDEVHLTLDDGSERRIDHVLLGTGYDVNIDRYKFLAPDLLSDVRKLDGYPDLRPGFRSSVPGLHFIGATAARSFGPLLYFVAGTEFASRELTSHICREKSALHK